MGNFLEKIKNHNIVKHMISSGALKLLSLIINLIYVPIVLNYLGVEKYGVWATLLTILSWISYFDVGIGNGLRNKLTEAISEGRKEDCKKLISSAYVTIAIIMGSILVIGTIISQFLNWDKILGTGGDIGEILVLIICLALLFVTVNFVISICRNILYAMQKASYVSLLEVSAQVLNLVLILILRTFTTGTLLSVTLVYGLTMIFVNLICSLILFIKRGDFRPSFRYVDYALGKSVTSLGLKFFIIQICALVLFSTDSLMISMLYGAREVTPYSTVNKVFTTIASVYTAFLAPIWSAFTKSKTENNYAQMIKSVHKLQLFMIPFCLFAILIAVFFKPITKIWLRQELDYTYGVIPCGLVYCIIMIWTNMYASVGNGLELMKVSMIVAVVQAVANIPLSYLFAEVVRMNATGILLGTDLSMGISAIVMPIYIHYWLRKKLKLNLAVSNVEESDRKEISEEETKFNHEEKQ